MMDVRATPWKDPVIRWILILGLLLHGIALARMFATPAVPPADPHWFMPDTPSYLSNAQMLREGRPLSPVFRERIVLPALLVAAEEVTGRPERVLWVVWLLHVPAALAAAWLTGRFTPSRWAPRFGAVLYFLWPAAFATGILVGTDLLHAQAVLVAAALTVAWADQGGRRTWVPLAAWMTVQLIRPSFYPAMLVLAPFLVGLFRQPGRPRRAALYLFVGLLLVPALFTCLNWRQYGIAAPSLAGVESLHRNVVARIRALQRNEQSPGPLTEYFLEERERVAKEDADWRALEIYRAGGGHADFAQHYRNLQEKGRAFVASNRAWFVRSSVMELENQLRRVHAVPGVAAVAGGSRSGDAWLLRIHKAGLLLAVIGWSLCLRRDLAYPLFYALCCGLILSACSMLWWESSRIRMPLEALAIPLVVGAVFDRRTAWALATVVALGWAPVRLLGAGEFWVVGVAALVIAALAAASLHGRFRTAAAGVKTT